MSPGSGSPSLDAVVDGVNVDEVAAAVLRCPSVAALSGGLVGEVATYLPGRRVRGIVVRSGGPQTLVNVHVVGVFGPTMEQISAEVHAAVGVAAPGSEIAVFIDDLASVDDPVKGRDGTSVDPR